MLVLAIPGRARKKDTSARVQIFITDHFPAASHSALCLSLYESRHLKNPFIQH